MPTDQEWLSQLPADQQPPVETPVAPIDNKTIGTPGQDYAGQIAEIYSGKNIYKLPYTAELPFKQNGKITTYPIGRLINSVNQHSVIQPKYEATLKELNTIRPEYESLKAKQDRFSELEKLQTWTEQNPQLFKQLWDSFTNREKLQLQHQLGIQGQQPEQATAVNQQMLDVISGLKNELGELKTWKSSWEKQQENAEVESNIKLIESEIIDFKKSYPFFDLDTPNDNGVTLVEEIIKHGIDKKYPTFKVAALDYLEPKLQERFKEQGRTEAVKNVREQAKKGIVASSDKPFAPLNGQSPQAADAKKSDYTLLSEAKALLEQYK